MPIRVKSPEILINKDFSNFLLSYMFIEIGKNVAIIGMAQE